MANTLKPSAFKALSGLSGLWWAGAVLGLFSLLAVLMLSLVPIEFGWAVLFAIAFGVARKKLAGAAALALAALLVAAILLGIPLVSISLVQSKLEPYEVPQIIPSEPIKLGGAVLLQGSSFRLETVTNPNSRLVSFTTGKLIDGEVDSVTFVEPDYGSFGEFRSRFPASGADMLTMKLAETAPCGRMLQSYKSIEDRRQGVNDRIAGAAYPDTPPADQTGPSPQQLRFEMVKRLSEECVVQTDNPARFDWKIRYGTWLDAEARPQGNNPINQFGFSHSNFRRPRPYRPGIRVGYAEIVGPGGTTEFRAFNPRAHALAVPLQFNRANDWSFDHAETSPGVRINEREYDLLPRTLVSEIRWVLR